MKDKEKKLYNYSGIIALIAITMSLLLGKFIDQFLPVFPNRFSFLFVPIIVSWLVLVIITFFSSPAEKTAHGLQATGIYTMVRNPLYTITLLLLYPGLCFLFKTYAGFLLIIPLFSVFMYLSHIEDEHLTVLLGDYYNEYKRKAGLFFPKLK
ncbi:hypothetical protein HYY69_00215 [Candidatus Woesearchaeota archaeon]|nr:hypothetical protein [Candidatus Woesearchaeota archaeon]